MITNMDEAQKIISGMYKKYWNGNNPIFDKWNMKECPIGRDEEGKVKSYWFVKSLLDQGFKVKAGYMTTGIRGYHTHWILWK